MVLLLNNPRGPNHAWRRDALSFTGFGIFTGHYLRSFSPWHVENLVMPSLRIRLRGGGAMAVDVDICMYIRHLSDILPFTVDINLLSVFVSPGHCCGELSTRN